MMTRRFSVLTALVAVLFAAGCARDADPVSPAAPPAAPTEAAPTEAAPTEPVPTKGGPAKGGQTVTGTVTAGVEPNCLLLSGGTTEYLLILNDQALRDQVKVGQKVTVTGRAELGMMTTCQQGTPFTVTAVRPN